MIRIATLDDADALAVVHIDTWQHAYRGIVPDEYLDQLDVRARADRWREILRTSDSVVTTLVDVDATGRVDGFASVGPGRDDGQSSGDAWEIYGLYVAPQRQGTGIGKNLLRTAMTYVPAVTTRVTLWVLTDNMKARQFYEMQGFRSDDLTQDIEIGGVALSESRYVFSR